MHDKKFRPQVSDLESRLALSGGVAAGNTKAVVSVASDVTTSQNTYDTLVAFTQSYPSTFGGPRYNPAFDINHNGRVGQNDGRALLRILPPLSRKIPLTLNLWIAPADRVNGHHPTNSGGVTHSRTPTILGRTTPGALIFTGSGVVDWKLKGPAVVADANGNFSLKVDLGAGINQQDFQVVDPYGQQLNRSFPIYWTTYRAYTMKHPRNL